MGLTIINITGAGKLLEKFPNAQYKVSIHAEMKSTTSHKIKEGDLIKFGDSHLLVVETPGTSLLSSSPSLVSFFITSSSYPLFLPLFFNHNCI